MATFVSEDLNEREGVNEGPTRLTGYDLKSPGTQERFVEFFNGNDRSALIIVEAGKSKVMSGLNEPYPDGLSVESRRGDGTLIANIFYEPSLVTVELADAEVS